MVSQILKRCPGILLCVLIAIPSWFLGNLFPLVGSAVFGILIGMLLPIIFKKPFQKRAKLEDGLKYTSKKILQYSIILLGFEMNLIIVIEVGQQSLYVMLFTLTSAFITAYVMGKVLKMSGNMTTLIGVGTSICGGSAIAATAPVIQAEDEDIANAISTIFLFNIVAVFIFPWLGMALGLSDIGFGMWAGTAINDTSSVVAASSAWSNIAGNDTALEFATIVKLTRTLMIVPIALVLAVYTAKKIKKDAIRKSATSVKLKKPTISATDEISVNSKDQTSDISSFSFFKVFPWFVIYFILAAMANTFLQLPEALTGGLTIAGKFMIVMAMSAIGLNTNLRKLIRNGVKPITLGLSCWFVVAVVSLIVQKFIGML